MAVHLHLRVDEAGRVVPLLDGEPLGPPVPLAQLPQRLGSQPGREGVPLPYLV